jgi:hypothetical protein
VDSHDVVVRVNNYKLSPAAGSRTDIFYSFFGGSIKKTARELVRDGVKLCICKCPDAVFMKSRWHMRNGKTRGTDFRYIYRLRERFWFCPTLVPSMEEFMVGFNLLGQHVPTTGFAAILEILSFNPQRLYLTGFDFFASGLHNVDEAWRPGNPADPIGHVPDQERRWLLQNMAAHPIEVDPVMRSTLKEAA